MGSARRPLGGPPGGGGSTDTQQDGSARRAPDLRWVDVCGNRRNVCWKHASLPEYRGFKWKKVVSRPDGKLQSGILGCGDFDMPAQPPGVGSGTAQSRGLVPGPGPASGCSEGGTRGLIPLPARAWSLRWAGVRRGSLRRAAASARAARRRARPRECVACRSRG